MASTRIRAALLGMALATVAAASPAAAASVDYFLKIDGVEGESSAARDERHKDWIEVLSLRFAGGASARGGVNVAAGDVNGDGRAESPRRPAGPGRVAAPGGNPQPIGLLLPAVQKVREAAARMPAWRGCRVGQRLTGVSLREAATGRTSRVLDAVVTACAAEQVSFNFSKVE
jgi:hypothetical protein